VWGQGRGEISAVAAVDDRGEAVFADCRDDDVREVVYAWLSDAFSAKDMHGSKGPALALACRGLSLAGVRMDTSLAAYLDSPGQRSYAVADVAQRVLGVTLMDAAPGEQLLFDEEESSAEPLAQQAGAIRELSGVLTDRLRAQSSLHLLDDIEMPLVPLLARMEHAGIAVDRQGLIDLSAEFGADMRRAEEEAHSLVGRPFNLGSPKQLQEILFGDRGLPKTKKIKTGYTTDAEALQQLFAQTGDPLLEQLLAWRDRSKLRQTVEGLLPLIDDAARIHTTFHQTVAATGRLSSSDPNLQNIPIRTEAGRRIRGCFVVGEGYETLLTADYSQIEMRIMAHLSEDDGLIAAFQSGEDLHTTVASQVFGVKPEKVDAVMETVGDATWSHSMRSLRPGGSIVISGATSGPNPPADLNRLFFLQLRIIGSTMGTIGELRELVDLLVRTGVRPVIDRVLPMDRAAEAFEVMNDGDVRGKLVLTR